MPLLELCKTRQQGSPLPLAEMQALLAEELKIAGAAARGQFKARPGQGDHNGACGGAAPAAAASGAVGVAGSG